MWQAVVEEYQHPGQLFQFDQATSRIHDVAAKSVNNQRSQALTASF